MPIQQRNGKWYYGSQGPFESREKAVEVAQAIHARKNAEAGLKGAKKKEKLTKEDEND